MAVKIRLARGGSKKRPYYRVVVAASTAPRDGSFIERIGVYDPMLPREHEGRLQIDEARVKHWLSVGAQPTERVARFLGQLGYAPVPAIPKQTKQAAPKAKAQERLNAEAAARAAIEAGTA